MCHLRRFFWGEAEEEGDEALDEVDLNLCIHCVFPEHTVRLLWFLGILPSAGWIQHTLPYAIWKPVSSNQHEHNLLPVYVAYSHGAWGLTNGPYAGFVISKNFPQKMKMTLVARMNSHWGFTCFTPSIAVFLGFFSKTRGLYSPIAAALCELISYCLTVRPMWQTSLSFNSFVCLKMAVSWWCGSGEFFYQEKALWRQGIPVLNHSGQHVDADLRVCVFQSRASFSWAERRSAHLVRLWAASVVSALWVEEDEVPHGNQLQQFGHWVFSRCCRETGLVLLSLWRLIGWWRTTF